MGKYIVSIGDSNKYEVEFPGSIDDFKNSSQIKELKEKATDFLKEKFPMGGFADVVPFHIEEAHGTTNYPKLDMANISDMLKSATTQIGVEKFTDKLNLNAPFDKD